MSPHTRPATVALAAAPAHTALVVAAEEKQGDEKEQAPLARDEYGRTPRNPSWGFGQYWSADKDAWVRYHFDEAAALRRLRESLREMQQRFTETEPELEA